MNTLAHVISSRVQFIWMCFTMTCSAAYASLTFVTSHVHKLITNLIRRSSSTGNSAREDLSSRHESKSTTKGQHNELILPVFSR